MSFWDKYLAPGDIRSQRSRFTSNSNPTPDDGQSSSPPPPVQRIDPAHRARRQNALFFGGLFFTGFSLFITRRALRRRQLPNPSQFSQSNATEPLKVEGSLEAVEALGLASINVFSIAMVTAGGLMKYFDVADLEDMRESVRRGVGFDVYGGDAEADKEMEEWVADILSRKDGIGNLKEGIAEKLMELEKKETERKARESQR